MSLSWSRALVVARREFLTTVRRKAFVFTLIGTPAYMAFMMWITTSAELGERDKVLKSLESLGVVDSSGLLASAGSEIVTEVQPEGSPFGRSRVPVTPTTGLTYRTKVRFYPDQASAHAALRAQQVSQVLVIPAGYLESGAPRRYAKSSSVFSSADGRAIGAWLSRNLVGGRVEPMLASRAARPIENQVLFNLNRQGQFELKDDAREMLDIMLPLMVTLSLGLCIIIGGQYLLQGVAEEKESRILESLLCSVSPEELMVGKLLGLGGAGLALVGVWMVMGLVLVAPWLATLQVAFPAWLLVVAVLYFLLGYLFFGSIMIGIAAVTNNMREAQQFSVWFTFANFVPLILFASIVGRPGSALAVWLSLMPPTAATAMIMRLTAPASEVPAWQIAASLAILAGAVWLMLIAAARVFRIGLLLYGKTPNLPEILRWARRA